MSDIRDVIEKMTPIARRAFEDSIIDLQSSVELRALERAIAAGRMEEALRVLHIDGAAFEPLREALRTAYVEAGIGIIRNLGPLRAASGDSLVVRFSVGSPRVENFLRTQSSLLIKEITDAQIEAVRTILGDAITRGQGARRTALDIVGRIDRVTQRRSGGTIGLLRSEQDLVERVKTYIREGDPRYFDLKLRDKRFDGMVARAGTGDRPRLNEEQVQKIGGRYSDRLLRQRGERVARTEVGRAAHAGADEGMRQVMESGEFAPEHVRKIWHATPDSRTRDHHRDLNGESRGLDEPFVSPKTGRPLMYPGDRANGAAEDVINCRCWMEHRIDFLGNLAGQEAANDDA